MEKEILRAWDGLQFVTREETPNIALGPVSAQLQELELALNRLGETAGALRDRYKSAYISNPGVVVDDPTKNAPESKVCELAEALRTRVRQVNNINLALSDVVRGCQL